MRRSSANRILAGAGLALLPLAFFPATVSAAPADAAALARMQGMWMVRPAYYVGATFKPDPPLTEAAKTMMAKRAAARDAGYVRGVSNMLCSGDGGPALFTFRSPFEVFAGFGRVTFIFETETFNQPRTVYLNEKRQPDSIFPSANGHSIGHWEGEALVVDTVGFDGHGRSTFPGGVPRSDKAHIVERFTTSKDGKTMTDRVTMEDAKWLAKPWTVSMVFDRMPNTEERFEVTCQPDLKAFNAVDLNAYKDADPEIQRLLDPNEDGSDPALKIAADAAKAKSK